MLAQFSTSLQTLHRSLNARIDEPPGLLYFGTN
jgi:hypothetical protein